MNLFLYLALFLQTPQQIQSADAAFRAGYAAMAKGDLPHAHAEFAKVVRLVPKVAAGHSAYGAVLLAEGDSAAAIPELEQAHRLDTKDETATLNLAIAYSSQRRYSESVTTFRLLRPDTAFTPEASLTYATALASTNDLAAATEHLRQAVAADPRSAPLDDALGTVLAQQQHYNEARAQFEQAIA